MLKKILLVVLLCWLFAGCSTDYSAVYQSIDTESKWDESNRIIINNSKYELPQYKVRDSKLYLMIQLTQSDWYLQTIVKYPPWGKPEISQLILNHSDIKAMIPVDWNNWLPKGFGEECIPKQIKETSV